ncbi:Protein of unknown function [Bacillus mycoides]|uniref:Uncharacterized protein n=1 Tax=Bacillus mycoides TaxID=1405 RepID=A0A1D3MTV4_BACMY|nr:Protein of unknown function [Bacillus mycoides]SCM89330.1 Protein of unknown function [Bacillus mycoides]
MEYSHKFMIKEVLVH